MTVCAPEPTSERVEPLNAPVATSGSKYRHHGLEVYVYTYDEQNETLHVVLTNCGLATHKWQRCTLRRKPCRRCYGDRA